MLDTLEPTHSDVSNGKIWHMVISEIRVQKSYHILHDITTLEQRYDTGIYSDREFR